MRRARFAFSLAAWTLIACGEVLPQDGADTVADAGADVDADVFAAQPPDATTDSDDPGVFAVRAELAFTGIPSAGSPSGSIVFDAQETQAAVTFVGALAGSHSIEVWPSASCDALVTQPLFAYVGTAVIDDAGSFSSTFFSGDSRRQLLGKVAVFRESDGRVSACGLVVR